MLLFGGGNYITLPYRSNKQPARLLSLQPRALAVVGALKLALDPSKVLIMQTAQNPMNQCA